VSQRKLTPTEIKYLQEALSVEYKISNIRLREGEYQYNLAKVIALFQLDLHFPDVKDIIKRSFGEEKVNDVQFIRKVQTILKKMEKSSIVKILPKKNPWDLQRYALSSFKFQDVDKNLVVLATDEEMRQAQDMLQSVLSRKEVYGGGLSLGINVKIFFSLLVMIVSYGASVWALVQPAIDTIVFVPTFSIAVMGSLLLGKLLSQR
jgi:hypothetical protein